MTLNESVQTLISKFVNDLRHLLSNVPLHDLISNEEIETVVPATLSRASKPRASTGAKRKVKTGKSGRLARRTPEQLREAAGEVAGLLKSNKDGLRSEEIREALGMDVREVPRVLKQAMEEGLIKILGGLKRATRYGAGKGSKAARKAPRKAPKKASKPARKPTAKKARKAPKAARKAPRKATRKPTPAKARKPAAAKKRARKAPAAAPAAEPQAA
jgi:hypothetical protein